MRQRRLVLFLAVLVSAPALSSVVYSQTIEEMAQGATVVVRGRVGQQQASWDEGQRRIETFTEVQVTEELKGSGVRTLVVRQPGGVVGGVGQRVSGAARFQEGEDVFLFLQPAADDPSVFLPVGLSAGKVIITSTPVGGTRAIRRLSGLAFFAPKAPKAGVIQPLDVEDLGSLEAFRARIKRALGRGGAQ